MRFSDQYVPDRAEDLKPRFHRSQAGGHYPSSGQIAAQHMCTNDMHLSAQMASGVRIMRCDGFALLARMHACVLICRALLSLLLCCAFISFPVV